MDTKKEIRKKVFAAKKTRARMLTSEMNNNN